jgi:hypothetical protein
VTVSHFGIEPTIAGSIVSFITAKHFLLTVNHFLCLRSYDIFMGAKSLSLVCQAASASLGPLTGASGSVRHGEVTTQSTSAKIKAMSTFFFHSV